jgi:hypothetical protein
VPPAAQSDGRRRVLVITGRVVELGHESHELLLGGYFCEKERVNT